MCADNPAQCLYNRANMAGRALSCNTQIITVMSANMIAGGLDSWAVRSSLRIDLNAWLCEKCNIITFHLMWIRMRAVSFLFCCAAVAVLTIVPALAAPRVAVTIKPVHALVAGVMGNQGTPSLIWDGAASPHNTSLKPSQIHALQNADVIFYVDARLETVLQDYLQQRGSSGVTVIALTQTPNLTLLPVRAGGVWGAHDHAARDGDDAAHSDEHDGQQYDPHIWLDPQNGKALTLHIATVLAKADPENADVYRANAAEMIIQLNALGREISAALAPVKDVPYLVFHDAYQYFERRFDLNGIGAITIDPGRSPGARRLKQLKDEIAERKAACVFAEPQFEVGYVTTVTEGTGARTATLDPLGIDTPTEKEAYAALLWTMTKAMTDCLSQRTAD
jgi:zinc transport system substrate-binding protein